MERELLELELPKESHELGQALAAIIKSSRAALEDGWQAGEDLPQIILQAAAVLPEAIKGLDMLDDEFKEMPVEMVMAIVLPVLRELGMVLKK